MLAVSRGMKFDVLARVLYTCLLLIQEPNLTRATTILTFVSCSEPLSGKARDNYCNTRCKKMSYAGGTCNNQRGDVCDCEKSQDFNARIYTAAPGSTNATTERSIYNIKRTTSYKSAITVSENNTLAYRISQNTSYPANVEILTPGPLSGQTANLTISVSTEVTPRSSVTKAYYNTTTLKIKSASTFTSNVAYENTKKATTIGSSSAASSSFTLSRTGVSVTDKNSSHPGDVQSVSITNMQGTTGKAISVTPTESFTTRSHIMTTASSTFTGIVAGVSTESKRFSTSRTLFVPTMLTSTITGRKSSVTTKRSPKRLTATSLGTGVPTAGSDTLASSHISTTEPTTQEQHISNYTADPSRKSSLATMNISISSKFRTANSVQPDVRTASSDTSASTYISTTRPTFEGKTRTIATKNTSNSLDSIVTIKSS